MGVFRGSASDAASEEAKTKLLTAIKKLTKEQLDVKGGQELIKSKEYGRGDILVAPFIVSVG